LSKERRNRHLSAAASEKKKKAAEREKKKKQGKSVPIRSGGEGSAGREEESGVQNAGREEADSGKRARHLPDMYWAHYGIERKDRLTKKKRENGRPIGGSCDRTVRGEPGSRSQGLAKRKFIRIVTKPTREKEGAKTAQRKNLEREMPVLGQSKKNG